MVALSSGRPIRLFNQVLLMAADEDDDTFEHSYKLKPLPGLAKRVSVFFNNNDRAMAVSDKTMGNPDRLGDDGPRVPRGISGKVTLIDCTPIVEGVVEHCYFLDTPRVVEDMQDVLRGTAADKISRREFLQETNRYRLVQANDPAAARSAPQGRLPCLRLPGRRPAAIRPAPSRNPSSRFAQGRSALRPLFRHNAKQAPPSSEAPVCPRFTSIPG